MPGRPGQLGNQTRIRPLRFKPTGIIFTGIFLIPFVSLAIKSFRFNGETFADSLYLIARKIGLSNENRITSYNLAKRPQVCFFIKFKSNHPKWSKNCNAFSLLFDNRFIFDASARCRVETAS